MAAKSKSSVSIHYNYIFYAILLLSAVGDEMKMVVEGKKCSEGLPWVEIRICDKGEVDQPCRDACAQRHGLNAEAYCQSPYFPGPPGDVCYCEWPC